MKQTAVEWLQGNLPSLLQDDSGHYQKLFQQAKAMEKEQIIDAYVECWKANMPDGYECKKSAEQYYNETYGTSEKA